MKPILKWTGGKTSELDIIKINMPASFNNYIEPFLGGGAVYFDLEHDKNILNDFNKELVCFYDIIKNTNKLSYFKERIEIFDRQRDDIRNLIVDQNLVDNCLRIVNNHVFSKYLVRELNSKQKTIDKINASNKLQNKSELSLDENHIIRKTACFSALYYMYRELYNNKLIDKVYDIDQMIYWFIMREISYSGMFRYSASGKFNVPYGGISYNNKRLANKIFSCVELSQKEFYKNTQFNNLDFEEFFNKYNYFESDDFIFLDPPYDSEFSQYNTESDFTKNDQLRLKTTLLKTSAKFMLVIKETDFIYDLYKDEFNITSFNKNYSVNFKNRNVRKVNHLIITNY